jgi:hypothetical protein
LLEEGLQESTSVNISLHRYPAVRGMKRVLRHWLVLMPQGVSWVFHEKDIIEGDAHAFAKALADRLERG